MELSSLKQRLGFVGELPFGVKLIGWVGVVFGSCNFVFGLAGGVTSLVFGKWQSVIELFGGQWAWVVAAVGGVWAVASLGLLQGREWGRRLSCTALLLFVAQAMVGAVRFMRKFPSVSPPGLRQWALTIALNVGCVIGIGSAATGIGYLWSARTRRLFQRR